MPTAKTGYGCPSVALDAADGRFELRRQAGSGHYSVGCIMKDAATPKLANHPELAKSEQALQQIQADQTSLPGLQARQSQTGSSGQPTAPGRKPLFRS